MTIEKKKKTLDETIDELQEIVGSKYGAMFGMDKEGKDKLEKFLSDRLAVVRELLGEERLQQVEKKMKELEPKVLLVSPRQLGSNEPIRDVDWHDMERYYILRKLLNG